ncbi:MAG TPA: hypothetical protein VFQ54_06045 [Thermomicrobiales bacterium]|nr:hypothetical protein [Thermomicrobiales bacterium]
MELTKTRAFDARVFVSSLLIESEFGDPESGGEHNAPAWDFARINRDP